MRHTQNDSEAAHMIVSLTLSSFVKKCDSLALAGTLPTLRTLIIRKANLEHFY